MINCENQKQQGVLKLYLKEMDITQNKDEYRIS